MTDQLKKIGVDNRDPNMRILNVSFGADKIHIGQSLVGRIGNEPEKFRPWLNVLLGEENANKWISSPHEANGLDQQLQEAVYKEIDKQLQSDPKFQAAMSNYRSVTRQLAEGGLTVVVAAGNDGNANSKFGLNLPPRRGV